MSATPHLPSNTPSADEPSPDAASRDDVFERAVEAVVDGDRQQLADLLHQHPALARTRSARAHRATLLHYVAANGVEDARQRTPPNAAAVARLLLDAGSVADAGCAAYGADRTTLDLLVSSVHPARAGVQVALVEALLDYGAAVDGVDADGSPLRTALAYHYLDAAQALVARGARVDTLVVAAGLGDVARVTALLAQSGTHADQTQAREHRERALGAAAAFGHVAVVALLADAGVDFAAADAQGMTALHWAAFWGHVDVVDALITRGAPLDAVNAYGGTVLGATRWAQAHAGRAPADPRRGALAPVDHAPVIAQLEAAGGRG